MRKVLFVFVFSLCSLCLCGERLFADPPVAMYLFPAGGQRGTTVKFHAGGLYFNQSCSLEMIGRGVDATPVVRRTESPWFEGPMLQLPESQRQEDYPRAMAGNVKIAKDAPIGDRYVLVRTAQGITSPLRFVVGDLPELIEDEIDGEPIPVAVSTPVTINGRIFPREDVDIWAVKLQKGQPLSVRVDADRIGSPLEARIEVRDASGQLIAEADASPGKDPRVQLTAASDGVHQVRITDARADGGPAFVYRLTLNTVNESIAESNTKLVRESDVPDPVRGNFLSGASVGGGTIATAGEVDRWSFSGRKGESLEIQLMANRIGSPLLGVLAITDSNGKELARTETGTAPASIDPTLKLSVPADGIYFVTVQDRFRNRGGARYTYQVTIARPIPDFDLRFTTLSATVERGKQIPLKIQARRHGSFNGPIAIRVEGLPAGVTIAKDVVIPAGQPGVDIPIKADTTAKVDGSRLHIRGTGMVSLAPFSSMFIPVTQTATWAEDPCVDQMRFAVAVATPFKIAGDFELKLIPRGTVHSRKYRIERNGFNGPIEIDLADKQARHLQGVTGPKFVVAADKSEFEYPITMPSWMDTGRTCRVCVMGTATIKDADGTEHVVTYSSREQNDQIIAVVEPERLGLRIERPTVLVEAGKLVEVKFDVRRGEGLKGGATVEVLVPRGMKGVSADSIKIGADAESGSIKLQFAADVRGPFPMPLTMRATVNDHRGLPVTAERTLELVSPR
jgi:hypothetical protein